LLRQHRTAIFGYSRAADGPSMSIAYYVMDGDEILISTMAERAKARAVARDPKVALSVLDEQRPPSYLQVYCDARRDDDFHATAEPMMRIAGVMAGAAMSEDVRLPVAEAAWREKRLMLRLSAYATFQSPPVHLHAEPDINPSLVHGVSAPLPWDAMSPPSGRRAVGAG